MQGAGQEARGGEQGCGSGPVRRFQLGRERRTKPVLRTFRGEYEQKIDGKGRLSIPVNFRKIVELGDPDWAPGEERAANFIIVYGDERREFLECYSVEAMAKLDARLSQMKNGPQKKYLTRFFTTYSIETAVDGTGRFVMPKKLRDKIGLPGEGGPLMFAGTNETFQIWRLEAYEAAHGAPDEAVFEGLDPDTDPADLLDMEF